MFWDSSRYFRIECYVFKLFVFVKIDNRFVKEKGEKEIWFRSIANNLLLHTAFHGTGGGCMYVQSSGSSLVSQVEEKLKLFEYQIIVINEEK